MKTAAQERRALAFILASVLLGAVGSGISMPVMPTLIAQLSGASLSDAARIGGWLIASFAVMQLLAAPLLGRLSDAYGRRPMLLLSLAALGIDCILMGLAPTLSWLFFARVVSGVFCANGSVTAAYIADISSPEQRARRFGLLSAAWGMGIFIGPALGGLLGDLNPRLPFFAAAALTLTSVAIGFLVLPESLAPENRRRFVWAGSDPIASLIRVRSYPLMGGLLTAALLFQVAYLTSHAVWPFFTMVRFHWSPAQIGWSLAFAGLAVTVVQGALLGPIIARIGEQRTALLGFAVVAATFCALSMVRYDWMLYALIVPYAVGSIGMSALASMMSKQVPANVQGEVQGVIASVANMAAVGTPLVMTNLFSFFTSGAPEHYFPGAPYLAGGLLALVGLVACARTLRLQALAS